MALPIIVCGNSPDIAKSFQSSIGSDYEVIHFVTSLEHGKSTIPAVLQGKSPNDPDNVGSKNYSKPAAAVVVGGAYDETAGKALKAACQDVSKVKWLALDRSKPTPAPGPEYGPHMAERAKEGLKKLVGEGKLEGDGVIFY